MRRKYKKVVVAGTFDHLHAGHKSLISLAFEMGDKVIIGLVKEPFGKSKLLANNLQSYQIRKKALTDYLMQKAVFHRAAIFPIYDIYGNADSDETIDALIVTRETYKNAIKINRRRVEKGKNRLKLIIGSMLRSKDGKIIRSERIRQSEIDREGNLYFDVFRGRKKLVLPERLRSLLRKPIGLIIKSKFQSSSIRQAQDDPELIEGSNVKSNPKLKDQLSSASMIITVGDIITSEIIKTGITPDIQIVDFRARRKPIKLSEIIIQESAKKARNQAGTISIGGIRAIREAFREHLKTGKKQQVVIRGEEDLMALPAILLAPLGAIVLYGQWDLRGAVVVEVTEEAKEKVKKIIQKFI